ncbi:MAG TPA: hypothetical protein PKA20_14865, partial [Burkholderiaceae bacterium]|nr:hypothetical protein [Burkholderiaceae bacterium]
EDRTSSAARTGTAPAFPAPLPPSLWYGYDGNCGGYGGLRPEQRHPDRNLVEQLHLDSETIPKDPSGNPWAPR